MIVSKLARGAFGGLLSLSSVFVVPALAPTAQAAPSGCAQYDISFARGTGEPAGVGKVGSAFASALQAKLPGKTFNVYGIEYAANYDFLKLDFRTLAEGADNLSSHLQDVADRCPNTQFVLGGYSQGAALIDGVTSFGVPLLGFSRPLPGDVASRIAGVALFGDLIHRLPGGISPVSINPDIPPKTINLCADGDPICENVDGGLDVQAAEFNANHVSYVSRGLTTEAAGFVADRINDQPPAQPAPPEQPAPPAPPAETAPAEQAPAEPEAEAPDAEAPDAEALDADEADAPDLDADTE